MKPKRNGTTRKRTANAVAAKVACESDTPIRSVERRRSSAGEAPSLKGVVFGSPAHAAILSEITARDWSSLPDRDRRIVLDTLVGAWHMASERPDPRPTAVTCFDGRRPVAVNIPGAGPVERHRGLTFIRPSMTVAEREALLEGRQRLLTAAHLFRDLAFEVRFEAAGAEADRQIGYEPATPARSSASLSELRGRAATALRECFAGEQGHDAVSAADLLWLKADELAYDDVRGRNAAFLDELAIRLALVARVLGDMSEFATGVSTQAEPGKKKNTATAALLQRLKTFAPGGKELASLKREVATVIVNVLNLRFSSGDPVHLFDLQAETCDRCGQSLLKEKAVTPAPGSSWAEEAKAINDAWRCPDAKCQERRQADREERRTGAVEGWLEHFQSISGSEKRHVKPA